MTDAERAGVREFLSEAHEAAKRAIERVKTENSLDHRLCAIALTEIQKGFAMAQLAATEAK